MARPLNRIACFVCAMLLAAPVLLVCLAAFARTPWGELTRVVFVLISCLFYLFSVRVSARSEPEDSEILEPA